MSKKKLGIKKTAALVAAGALAASIAVFGLAACGGGSGSSSSSSSASSAASSSTASSSAGVADKGTITVAAVPTPHAEVLEDAVAPILKEQGWTLEVKEFNDYVQPNTVTEEGDVDANYFQHKPYLDNFNDENGTHLVGVVPVHYEPFGLYAGKKKSLEELEDGDTVAVPNDATNEARALLLLQQEGLITLENPDDIEATPKDIAENPKNLKFKEVEAATVPNILEDVAIAGINSNYALEAGLHASTDALAIEDPNGTAAQTYANLLVVKEGNENTEATQALAAALNSDAVRDYINSNYDGAVLPVF